MLRTRELIGCIEFMSDTESVWMDPQFRRKWEVVCGLRKDHGEMST